MVKIEEGIRAVAYVVTSAYAMITAEVPVYNDTDRPVQFSVYNAVMDPEGQCLTTTETLYRLGVGERCTVTDELLRIRDPRGELEGYTITCTLSVNGEWCDRKSVAIEVI